MATQSVIDFLTSVTTDDQLQQEVAEAISTGPDTGAAIAEVAREHGYEFEVGELSEVVAALRRAHTGELSDAELEDVAGGGEAIKVTLSNPGELSHKINDLSFGSTLLDPTSFGSYFG